MRDDEKVIELLKQLYGNVSNLSEKDLVNILYEKCAGLEKQVNYITSLLENMNEFFLTYDISGKVTFVNKRSLEFLGYSAEEILGKSVISFVHSEDKEVIENQMDCRLLQGLAGCYEVRLMHISGEPRVIRISATPIFENGIITGGSVLGEDITERKRMEEELRESEETYRTIFENTGTAMLIVDGDTTVRLANSQVEKLVLYTREEIENKKSWTEFVPGDHLYVMRDYHFSRRKDPSLAPSAYEFTLLDRLGNFKDIFLNIGMIAGTPKSVVSMMDITEAKGIERKLAESEEIYRTIFENTGTAMLIIEEDTTISLGNTQLERLTGYSKEEVENKKSWTEFVYPKDLEMMVEYHSWRRKDRDGAPSSYEFKFVDRYGDIKDMLLNLAMIPGTKKSLVSLIDITDRKQAEKHIATVNEELEAALEHLKATEDELRHQIILLLEKEKQLRFVSMHDTLTGLCNRAYFEEQLHRMEEGGYDPLGLAICDVDGLKLVNDTMGHDTGDSLLTAVANVIKNSFREGDIVARVGGDEFAVILPNTALPEVEEACRKVYEAVAEYNRNNNDLPLSISVGFAVRADSSRTMDDLFREADNSMYRKKLHSSRSARSAIVQTLMKAIEARDHITEGHAERLQGLAAAMAAVLGLPERSIVDLRLLAQFHDIGKVGIPDRILFKKGRLTPLEYEEMRRHSEIGHRIAQSAPDMLPIAEWILLHHEWWNGEGYPLGLKGEIIPLECRILAIADAYDAMTSDRPYRRAMAHEDALEEIRRCAGTQFDPNLVEKFAEVLESLRK
ncbi:MAG TPA: hypothetical protein DEF36_05495 [Desulfotomaculum sp.]|nr:hypothetical protein [Desulfotomaculum sp.]